MKHIFEYCYSFWLVSGSSFLKERIFLSVGKAIGSSCPSCAVNTNKQNNLVKNNWHCYLLVLKNI